MNIQALIKRYPADIESGISTAFDGSSTSLVQHMSEKFQSEPKVIHFDDDVSVYGWCVDNEVTMVGVRFF